MNFDQATNMRRTIRPSKILDLDRMLYDVLRERINGRVRYRFCDLNSADKQLFQAVVVKTKCYDFHS